MSKILLLGAGASFGSDSQGTPPLGGQLFDALVTFNPPGWGAVPRQFVSQFRNDFEAAMVALDAAYPHILPPLQRAMAAYFFQFAARPSNTYARLARRIAKANWSGMIATLNYERLLEQTLGFAGLRPTIGSPTAPGQTVELCMPHGCCHLFCEGARGMASGVSFAAFGVQTDGPVVVIADPIQFRQRIEQDAFPPVMSYFEPSKRTTAGASFINGQRARFAEQVIAADTVVSVGVRVRPHDAHIWEPLSRTAATLVFCAGAAGGQEFELWSAQVRHQHQNAMLARYFDDEFEAICTALGI